MKTVLNATTDQTISLEKITKGEHDEKSSTYIKKHDPY